MAKGVKASIKKSKTKPKSMVDSKAKKKIKVKAKVKIKTKVASKSSSTEKSNIKAKKNLKKSGLGKKNNNKSKGKITPKVTKEVNKKESLKKKKKLLFSPGDFVVYPTHGVGQVTNVEIKEIAGHKLKLFVISFDEDRMTLRVPVTKVSTSGLRKLISRKKMDVALETLKGRARVKRTMWSRRAQEYEAKINSGDPLAIAEVVRDLHRKTGQPEQSFSERQIFESACHRLAMELAAIEKIDIDTATEKMEELLKAA
ncbi:MAG: CarD family transcriptional regulator [Pseudomonadota bacterium]|nr:CarD family transcriptional regulator [Pseudomonadota bacterium]